VATCLTIFKSGGLQVLLEPSISKGPWLPQVFTAHTREIIAWMGSTFLIVVNVCSLVKQPAIVLLFVTHQHFVSKSWPD
jgi:hypothetical protein